MKDFTRLLQEVQAGDLQSAQELLPLVYNELRRLAAYRMRGEAPGHTLQPTALVHEAWIRLAGREQPSWENRAHFFTAAAEAMRRILIDHARRKLSQKRGAGAPREELDEEHIVFQAPPDEILAVHACLDELAAENPQAAELVKLRYFVGLTMEETASVLNLSKRTAEGIWTYAKVWLARRIRSAGD